MKGITKLKINQFKIKQLGYDFMGFTIKRLDECTAHHLIIPARHNGKLTDWNTVILNGETSHPYWHLIEIKDPTIAYAITSEMIDMNIKGYLDEENIKNIHDLLDEFEAQFGNEKNSKGKLLIKREYKQGRAVL